MKRTMLVLAAALAAAPAAFAGMHHEVAPVRATKVARLGTIVTTTHRLAVYTWSRERGGKVRCTGACARTWVPLTVMKDDMVVKHVKGVMGTLGTVVRPGGALQVTLDGHPLYTHRGDTMHMVDGNGMHGWTVVKA